MLRRSAQLGGIADHFVRSLIIHEQIRGKIAVSGKLPTRRGRAS